MDESQETSHRNGLDDQGQSRASDAASESPRHLYDTIDSLPVAIFSTDADGRLTYFNQACVEFAGYQPTPGDDWTVRLKLFHEGKPIPHNENPLVIALGEGRSFRDLELEVQRPDGSIINSFATIDPIRNERGEVAGVTSVFHDITAVKQAEQTKARLAAIVETSDDAIITKGLDGIITSWNASAQRLFGYTAEEAIGQHVTMLIPADRLEEEPTIIDRLQHGDRVDHFETKRARKDGNLLDVSLTISPLKDSAGRVVGASKIARNITERKQAEEALAHQRRLYEGVLSTTPDLAYIFDLDHRFIYANEGLLKMWGKTWEEAIGKNCLELGYESWQAELHDSEIQEVINSKKPVRGVIPLTGTFGRRLYDYILTPVLDGNGEVQAVAGTTRDVTDIKNTEQALRESEEKLAKELAGMTRLHELSVRLADQDDLEQVIHEVMSAAAELLGTDRCTAQLVDHFDGEEAQLKTVAIVGFDPASAERIRRVMRSGFTPCTAAVQSRDRVIVEDVAAYEYAELAAVVLPMGIRSVMSTPLLASNGALLGMFTTYWDQPHRPSEHQLRFLDLYAQQAARQVERRASEHALRQSEARLAHQVADLETLRQLSIRVASTGDRTTALDDVLGTAIAMVGAAKGNVQLYDQTDATLKIIAHRGFNQEFLEYFRTVPAGYSCCGTAMQQRERVIIENVFTDDRFSEFGEIYSGHGFEAVQSTPLFTSDGRLLGVFSTHFAKPYHPSERDLRVLDQIAQQAGRIIERTSAEEALRESEARFRMLADNMAQLAWTCDQLGCVTWYNKRWLDYTGLSFDEMKAWGWTKCQHPDHVERVVAGVLQSRETGEIWEDTFPMRGKDGQFRWFLSTAYPIRDEQGVILRWFGTSTDITEQRAAEEALREADRRKDEFLATLAHELRNPLAPIRSGLEVLRIAKDDPAVTEEIRNTMVRQTEQLVRLIDDLLDVSRITRGRLKLQLQEADLNDVVKSAVEATRPFIEERKHQLTVNLPSELAFVTVDPHRLAQVLSNLLHNAAKYSPNPGPITLDARIENRGIVLSVKDQGLGIPQEKLTEVFEMFSQIERSGQNGYTGLGIGLTLAKSFVEMHGGTIELQSEGTDRGTEVIVRIPGCLKSSTTDQQSPLNDTDSTQSCKQRVLIVDDNKDAARILSLAVKMLGSEVAIAHDGVEALETAKRFKPDVILLDLGMPRMDGYEAAKRIRRTEWGKDIVLVALTGWGQEEDKRKTKETGFDHHLVKPADPKLLSNILTESASTVRS